MSYDPEDKILLPRNNPYGERIRPGVTAGDEPGAKQSFRDEVDINNLVAKYTRFGFPEKTGPDKYVDCTRIQSFQDNHNMRASVETAYHESSEYGQYDSAYDWFMAQSEEVEVASASHAVPGSDPNEAAQDEPAAEPEAIE